MPACARPVLCPLVLLAHVVCFGATAQESPPSPPPLHGGGQMRTEECLGDGCSSEGFGLLQQKSNAQSLSTSKLEAMSNAAMIQHMVQQGRITATMARGLSNASLLLEAAGSAGFSSWTLADAENHIAATVKELRSQHLSRKGPQLSLLAISAQATPATVTGIIGQISSADVADTIARAHGVLAPIAGFVGGEVSGQPTTAVDVLLQTFGVLGAGLALFTATSLTGGSMMFAVALLSGVLPFITDQPPNPFEQLYHRIMTDLHITVSKTMSRTLLQSLGHSVVALVEELEWVPRMLNQSDPDYSRILSLTYELMAQHDCAIISHRIRTAWRHGTVTEKGHWAAVVMPLAEMVLAIQQCLLLSLGRHDPAWKEETRARLKWLVAKDDLSWGPMFRTWLEDLRAGNIKRRKDHLGDWTYTGSPGPVCWADGFNGAEVMYLIFQGKCHLETDVCKATGCVGENDEGGIGRPDNSWRFNRISECEDWLAGKTTYYDSDPRSRRCDPEVRDKWLESVYDGYAPNQWNAGMVSEEDHYNIVAGLLVMQVDGLVKLMRQVLADTPPVYTGPGESLPHGAPRLGQCQGDCDSDDECEKHLVCHQRHSTTPMPAQCVGDIAANTSLNGVDFCVMPELRHLGWHNVNWGYVPYGTHIRKHQMKHCEGDCDDDTDCKVGLHCYHPPEHGVRRVHGCWGVPVPEMDYCLRIVGTITNNGTKASRPEGALLDLCEGDCSVDSDCKPGLVCYQRDQATLGNGDGHVPGCQGLSNAMTNYDYCVLP